jgi:hypothetical protein
LVVLGWLVLCGIVPGRAVAASSYTPEVPPTERRAEAATACEADREEGFADSAIELFALSSPAQPEVEPACHEIASSTVPIDAHGWGWRDYDTRVQTESSRRSLARKGGCSVCTLETEVERDPALHRVSGEISAAGERVFVPLIVYIAELPRPPGA